MHFLSRAPVAVNNCYQWITGNVEYPPFGMMMQERSFTSNSSENKYGFNGKEMDNETYQGSIAFEARIYDSRLGRFFSTDPLEAKYPFYSCYQFAANQPILSIDILGLEGSDDLNPTQLESPEAVAKLNKFERKLNRMAKKLGTNWYDDETYEAMDNKYKNRRWYRLSTRSEEEHREAKKRNQHHHFATADQESFYKISEVHKYVNRTIINEHRLADKGIDATTEETGSYTINIAPALGDIDPYVNDIPDDGSDFMRITVTNQSGPFVAPDQLGLTSSGASWSSANVQATGVVLNTEIVNKSNTVTLSYSFNPANNALVSNGGRWATRRVNTPVITITVTTYTSIYTTEANLVPDGFPTEYVRTHTARRLSWKKNTPSGW